MSRIHATFEQLKAKGQKAFIPFLTVGFPSLEETVPLIEAMGEAGADMIELGVPFSDPLADGPTIQATSQIALKNGVTVEKCLEVAAKLRERGFEKPLLLMGYVNPFLAYGVDRLAENAARAGIDGFIIPDLPPQESTLWTNALKPLGIDLIMFVAPTTREERFQLVLERSSGFIYCITVTGVTGARDSIGQGFDAMVSRIREKCSLPLVAGFGISTPEHVSEVTQTADGAIVASAILKQLQECKPADRVAVVKHLVKELKGGTQ